jgi:large subunit ribosomal protein L17
LQSLAEALIIHGSIETTLQKAKETVSYTEKLITKAKLGTLHARRQLIASLQTISSAHKLMDDIAPKLKGRNSGYLRIEHTKPRLGDNAQMARISFVDDITKPLAEKKPEEPTKSKPAAKKPATKAKATRKTAEAKA